MKHYNLAQLVALVNEYIQKNEGIWVRTNDDFTICLVGVADATTGQFIAKHLPCAKNSKRYQVPYSDIKALDQEGTTETTIRISRIVHYDPQLGA